MAAYNAENYIAASIESVLNQTYQLYELLIVDDGSTDDTVEIVRSFHDPRIRLIQNDSNKGLPFTRNVALKEAKGELLAILDSDDIAFPNRLEMQIEYFISQPRLGLLGGKAYVIDKHGKRTGQDMPLIFESEIIHSALLFGNCFVHSTVMMRTAIFREMGGYPNHPVAQDYGLISRIALKHDVYNIAEYIGEYRIHDHNITDQKKHLVKTQLRTILLYQLDKLLPSTLQINPDILLDPIQGSIFTLEEHHKVYHNILINNRIKKQYPIQELERILLDKWFNVVMEKGKSKTLPLFFRKPIFNRRYVTSKQLRRVFKQSFKYLVGIKKH